ncbi:MAG: TolC family protein [Rhodospirillaceae bacterium]
MTVSPEHSALRIGPRDLRRGLRPFLLSGTVLALCACAVSPDPFTDEEKRLRISEDKALMFGDLEPITKPIGLEEAMARAVKYNLDHRVELLNSVVSTNQLELAHYDMLPKLAATAGFNERNNDMASTSTTVLSHINSTEPAVSQERRVQSAQIQLSWNVLDFGVSYIRAKQMADKALMADEQRRKVVQNIIQDVRYAYWRAVAADRLLDRLMPLTKRTETALADARRLEGSRVREPMADLQYQRALLSTLERLKSLRRDLVAAKAQLAALMSLPPGSDFHLVMPRDERDTPVPQVNAKLAEMEEVALANRPELIQAAYQHRISRAETYRILLEMLPGFNLGISGNFDSNKYTVNHAWASYGVNMAWNLLTLASTPERLDVVASDNKMLEMKRAALSMAVMAQVNVASLRYEQAQDEYTTARDQADVEGRIFGQTYAAGRSRQVGELSVIQAEADDVFSTLRRDTAYASLQNAYGAILVALGADPLPDVVTDYKLPTIANAIHANLVSWADGSALQRVLAKLKEEPKSAATPAPATASAPASEPARAPEPATAAEVPKVPEPVKAVEAPKPQEPGQPADNTKTPGDTIRDLRNFLYRTLKENSGVLPMGEDPMHHG